MLRFSKIMILAAAVFAVASCGSKARIDGVLESAPSSDVVVKLLDVNKYETLDTVKTDVNGEFSYKVSVKKGQPEFIYLFHNDTKIASLLLESGDKVIVSADTLGRYTVEGSEESLKLAQVEKDFTTALSSLQGIAKKIETSSEKDAEALRRELGQEYIKYYRDRVKYVMGNSKSLTVVPVFFQYFSPDLPVFSQSTDAIHFINAADSLETVYPDSRYVKALRNEAQKRYGYMEIQNRLNTAEEIGFPDIELPDLEANKIRLSEVDSKVIMLYFWSASDAGQKMFNLDVLKGLYEDYHKKGFEIYQISLDVDKTVWANVVRQQNLPWINVCDSRGASSPYATMYNITVLPSVFLIKDGELVDGQMVDEKSIRVLLDKLTR